MIFLYVLATIIFLVLLILFTQLRFKIVFNGEFSFVMYLGIFKIPLKNKKKQKPKDKNVKQEKKAKAKKPNKYYKKIKEKGLAESFNALVEFLKPCINALNDFSSHIKINPLYIKIVLAGDDAASLAIDYGRLCAVFYPALNALLSKVIADNYSTDISVDYLKNDPEIFVKAQIKFRIIHSIKNAFILIKEFLKLKNKFN